MKKIYIFTQFPRTHAPQRLKEEATNSGLEAFVFPYKKMSFELKGKKIKVFINGRELENPDYAIFRSYGKGARYRVIQQTLVKWLLDSNTRVLGHENMLNYQLFDKSTQHTEFMRGGIPYVPTEVFMDMELVTESAKKFPFVLKSYAGSHGDKVRKIEKLSDIFFFTADDAPMLKQPFLEIGKDIRVITLGGKAIGAMMRTAPEGEFLTNYSAGGSVEDFSLDENPEVREIAEKTASHFEAEYAGIDLIQDGEGNWLVLEVNRFCQFEGFELSTHTNVAKTVIEYITSN